MSDGDPLKPLLSAEALRHVRSHTEALRAMAHTRGDRILATGLELLLENHDRRKQAIEAANAATKVSGT